MCRIFATQDPASYAPVARALRLNGHMTSIRIGAAYWSILDEMAEREGMSTPHFIGKLYDEVLDWHGR
jgi:predicted DNA-binding ribbon-helix-helix protein